MREKLVYGKVKNRHWWLYSWSKVLWYEYYDEGFTEGRLKSNGDNRMKGRASGLQWVTDRADKGLIKRRYIEKKVGNKIKEVTNADWYTRYTYPAHPDPYK